MRKEIEGLVKFCNKQISESELAQKKCRPESEEQGYLGGYSDALEEIIGKLKKILEKDKGEKW